MSPADDISAHRERLVAGLLRYGTWCATAIVGAGVALELSGHDGLIVAKTGIAVFILLPILRVATLLAIFIWERDRTYAAFAALVLSIIAAGAIAAL